MNRDRPDKTLWMMSTATNDDAQWRDAGVDQ